MQLLKRLYQWVLHWAETPYGVPALFVLAFAESSFFPVPPDVLLIALSLSIPKNAFKYALVCAAGSVTGGAFGYLLGWQFWEIAQGILFRYIDQAGFETVRYYFLEYEAWAVGIAGFTPIPYKVFTIAAGFMRSNFSVFIIASLLSRSARFFLVAGLIYLFGPPIREFIDKYFELATLVFTALLIGGILVLRFLF
ncbi:MAG: DedA family protein [Anaerolineae bacterium]|nr:DedA family protein [Anaerolineae bacterium]